MAVCSHSTTQIERDGSTSIVGSDVQVFAPNTYDAVKIMVAATDKRHSL